MEARKRLLLALAPRYEALEGLPVPSDSDNALSATDTGLCCPNCGSLNTAVQTANAAEVEPPPGHVEYAEDAEAVEVVVCGDCSAEFNGAGGSVVLAAAQVVGEMLERRSARIERAERSGALRVIELCNALTR